MSDQCKHCSVIFNEKACDSTQCSIHESTYAWRLKATIERLQAKIERLRAIVDKSPKCWRLNEQGELVQDVAIMPGMEVYVLLLLPNEQIEIPRDTVVSVQWFGGKSTDNTIVNLQTYTSKLPFCLYSTREAAEAAKEKQ